MSYLFIVENNIAKPNTETLLIEPFKTIWERDKTKDKEQAIKEFTFIELMSSKKDLILMQVMQIMLDKKS